jgi:hypothetical protein
MQCRHHLGLQLQSRDLPHSPHFLRNSSLRATFKDEQAILTVELVYFCGRSEVSTTDELAQTSLMVKVLTSVRSISENAS